MESNNQHWSDAIDSLLHPTFTPTDGVTPPTDEAVFLTKRFLCALRNIAHDEPPTLIIPMDDGGILTEARDEHKRILWALEVQNNRDVHFYRREQKRGDE